MNEQAKRMVSRGLVACVAMGVVPVIVGCVSRSAFEAEVEKNQHLQYVKTEQDIEREGLHADVGALRRAYSEQSLRMTFLEGVVQQTSIELKQIDTKLSSFEGKLTALGQDVRQQQGELARVTAQGAETMRLLQAMTERQEEMRTAVQTVAGKIEGMKKAVAARSVTALSDQGEVRAKVKGEKTEGVPSTPKGAAPRAGEQKLSLRQGGEGKDGVPTSVEEPKGVGGVPLSGNENGQTVSTVARPGVVEAPASGMETTRAVTTDGGGTLADGSASKTGDANAVGQNGADTGDRSPLLTTSTGSVHAGKGAPVKKSWGDWASDKWESAKGLVKGKPPVQAAADPANATPAGGTK